MLKGYERISSSLGVKVKVTL
jgi:hypothetical protein